MNRQNLAKPAAIFLAALVADCSKHEQIVTAPQAEPTNTPAVVMAATPTPAPAPETKVQPAALPPIDAAGLLTSDELLALQGEAVSQTTPTVKSEGGFTVSQCLFTLPTYSKSIVVTVTQKGDGPDARDPAEFWRHAFHENKSREAEEEETTKPPEPVAGLGDEAFWTADRVGGALHVLKGNTMIRIGIGGAGDGRSRLEKARAIAELILKRL